VAQCCGEPYLQVRDEELELTDSGWNPRPLLRLLVYYLETAGMRLNVDIFMSDDVLHRMWSAI
jgi:hypothetical protein